MEDSVLLRRLRALSARLPSFEPKSRCHHIETGTGSVSGTDSTDLCGGEDVYGSLAINRLREGLLPLSEHLPSLSSIYSTR